MTKQAPIEPQKLVKLLEKLGYVNKTTDGLHAIFQREGNVKSIMIQQTRDLTPALLKQVLIKVSDQTGVSINTLNDMLKEM
ncbi:hypothetical protein CUJ83_12910 [Methanocella sp. CWC-04]|uniref:Uncharacterized protein n=1 Tax=Methanooceanicella nereidis TaxID=2052831 RepID=A0AAP2RFL5_9EURY|nr:hypothetical protein [Methanocella sp. CWC-04]MCD1295896.1 hypothetical protein [Methanocella sp. CWC-04]